MLNKTGRVQTWSYCWTPGLFHLSGPGGGSENVIGAFLHQPAGFVGVWSQGGEAGRRCDGDATQADVQTVDLRGHRDLGEEGAISWQPGQTSIATAVAALDVSNDVEDLLTFCLTSHSTDVQDGRHVLLPERKGMKARVTGSSLRFLVDSKAESLSLVQLSCLNVS